eukprot:CAMPEP_0180195536 /NCGR_PEP_ID=MMETSP0987-20121128/3629_1 /TAXON_ID=697907 /ORGANISM="non described non described, Strain CCMP2293" /LENGTH=144 /DNA_ID=CAMNT_0022150363 /DNA_START=91 /DNA_END=521 /DNA_ORIENTATION=-
MVVISVNLEECEGLVNWRTLAQIPDEPAKRRPERVDKDDGDEDEGESDDEPDEGRGGGGGAGIYQRIIAKWSSMNRKSTGGGEDGGGSESEGYTSDDYDLDDDGLIDNTELQDQFEKKVISKRARKQQDDPGFGLEDEDDEEQG